MIILCTIHPHHYSLVLALKAVRSQTNPSLKVLSCASTRDTQRDQDMCDIRTYCIYAFGVLTFWYSRLPRLEPQLVGLSQVREANI